MKYIIIIILFSNIIYGQFKNEFYQSEEDTLKKAGIDTFAAWRRGHIEGYTHAPSIAQGQNIQFK